MSDISLTILPETPDDAPAIDHLNARTFGPGRFAKTAYRIREEVTHIPELSFTARVGTLLVGSVRLSPILIGEARALLLGPLTVEPPFRDRGIGQALIARALEAEGFRGIALKWPNDIIHRHLKVGGILIEVNGDALGPARANPPCE